jgi:hypothetical protein
VAACLLTNATESQTLYRQVFSEVFGPLTGATLPEPPRPVAAALRDGAAADLERHAGHYERVSRQFDVSVRDGQLRMVLTMTGNLAALTASEPEDLLLHPADSSGNQFVLRSRDEDPWAPLSFGRLGDGTPYIYLGGRVTPRTG